MLGTDKKDEKKFKSYSLNFRHIQYTPSKHQFLTATLTLILCILLNTKSILAGRLKDRLFIFCLGITDLKTPMSKVPFSAFFKRYFHYLFNS